jgi:uncharacterized lipoprotein YmbA
MRSAVLVCVALLVACAGSPTLRTQYLLRAEPTERSGRSEARIRVGLGRVAVAPYLDQAGIVVETQAGQVQAAREHQWAEPLSAGLRSFLRAEISNALGYDVSAFRGDDAHWDYAVDVYVDRLHGTMAGTAVLDAGYWITAASGAREVVEYRFSASLPLAREGYPGLVEAEAKLARQLARAIAASLRATDEERPNP